MRLTLFLCALLGTPATAQQIGRTDPVFESVTPVQFCVNMLPADAPTDQDLVEWTFPSGAPETQPIASNIVPARPGQAFGFLMRVNGTVTLENVAVVVDHPPLADVGQVQHAWTASFPFNRLSLSYFAFGRPNEATAGDWTFTYHYKGRAIYKHQFTLLDTGDDTLCADG